MNSIHPTAIIDGNVVIGERNFIGAHAMLTGPVVLGDDNWVGAGVVIGAPPEVRAWQHLRGVDSDVRGAGVVIGDRNIFREYSQVHQGWEKITRVGNHVFVMNQSYIAHDCELSDGVTLASSVLLAGHVRVAAGANLGLGTSVHQRRFVGAGAMLGMGSVVIRDVPPFATAFGNPAVIRGVNRVGMSRDGFAQTTIDALDALYRGVFEADRLCALSTLDGLADPIEEWISATAQEGASGSS